MDMIPPNNGVKSTERRKAFQNTTLLSALMTSADTRQAKK
jgi:hypothetical protein